jgi:phosphate:Na+ symporter
MNFVFDLDVRPRMIRASLVVFSGLVGWVLFGPALAAEGVVAEGLGRLEMGMGLFGGLALFLAGMEQMGDGLKAAAGERMKEILAKLTRTRMHAAVTGAIVTAVIQSSSVTTVLVVGFVSAGLLTLTQSIGIIMGANIGTTVTAQIVAFKVEKAALLMIAVGFGMIFLTKQGRIRHYGAILMGLGLVFFGMGIMSDAMRPLRAYEPFLNLMASMQNPVLAILVGAAFTALIQSSSATTGIIIVMASQGFVTLDAGIALAFGANIGTCITAVLASLGKPPDAARAAVVHVLFNVLGVLLWVALIPLLAELSVALSPAHPELSGTARLAAETPRQIANANTLFNVINTALFIGFAGMFAKLATWLVPDRPVDERFLVQPKFLDKELIATPTLALERVRLEVGHLGEIVQEMLAKIPDAIRSGEVEPLEEVARMDDRVDLLETEILKYLGQVRQRSLSVQESETFTTLMRATDNLESIGDVIETNVVGIGKDRLEKHLEVSDAAKSMLTELHAVVTKALAFAVQAVRDEDQRAAQEVVALKGEVDRRVDEALAHQAGMLAEEDPKRVAIFRLEMELVEKLKRIHTLSKRIARGVLPEELASRVV